MKVNFIKQPGGILFPSSDIDCEKMTKFKSFDVYEVDIKLSRNPKFHGKVFKFLEFCFDHWRGDREFLSNRKQFDVFRENLTVFAGYYESYFKIDGSVRVVAQSLSYENMTQAEFECCYIALTNAAMRTLFYGCGEETRLKLISFF